MTPLELLTLILLSNNRPLRDSVVPAAFGGLSEKIADLQKDHVAAIRSVLSEELSINWDGSSPLAAVVAEKCRELAAVQSMRNRINEKRSALHRAALYLDHPNIAGSDGIAKAGEILEGV